MFNKHVITTFTIMSLIVGGNAWAKVSPVEAEKLKGELTPMGAERAGNADGTIPAWDGGLASVPAGIDYKGEGTIPPDPFVGEKPLFEINGANVSKYEDRLTSGVVALLKKKPEMSLNVYPTHRTAAAPQEIYDATFRNATLIELSADGLDVNNKGVNGGVPFPIPQNAAEVVFNHHLRWRGTGMDGTILQATVQANGQISWGGNYQNEMYPWNILDKDFTGDYYKIVAEYGPLPARRKGEIAVVIDSIGIGPRKAWQYLPGQRRVRRAPSIAFDTPNPAGSGIYFYDETFIFNGSLERYDWKLVGKKEIYLPYNCYRMELANEAEKWTADYPGKGLSRWELHRYWVVEATLKEGYRHSLSKRVLYIDEDSWNIIAADGYDAKGNLWHVGYSFPLTIYSMPGLIQGAVVQYDLTRDDYSFSNVYGNTADGSFPILKSTKDDDYYTPESGRRLGRR